MSASDFTSYLDTTGDRSRLYLEIAAHTGARRVLYPGSYLDIAPSYVWPDVTYLDADDRATRMFADAEVPLSLAVRHKRYPGDPLIAYIPGDYTRTLPELPAASWDLVISLSAGLVSEHATRCLKPGGYLLANNSHADAGLACTDPHLRLSAVVGLDGTLSTGGLDRYLRPRRPPHPSRDDILKSARSVPYTETASAYLFQLRGS
ncbi:hypothetical protein [Phytomonospora endophytica]|uniref:Methyltransferase n=1 Tax=Phytomonospora endophytica TaxID=714109 RepID=A0A841FL23_9ACTN|nr:hypothetical protein [Phytomonospora endophytica]MBB6034252.1 hypothetical protein [Phytomonospora endophytica]GIG66644.1 hypothetical protein Pen01_29390 [Phytomonospora endophytica]